jgi:hypothetical protein
VRASSVNGIDDRASCLRRWALLGKRIDEELSGLEEKLDGKSNIVELKEFGLILSLDHLKYQIESLLA